MREASKGGAPAAVLPHHEGVDVGAAALAAHDARGAELDDGHVVLRVGQRVHDCAQRQLEPCPQRLRARQELIQVWGRLIVGGNTGSKGKGSPVPVPNLMTFRAKIKY